MFARRLWSGTLSGKHWTRQLQLRPAQILFGLLNAAPDVPLILFRMKFTQLREALAWNV